MSCCVLIHKPFRIRKGLDMILSRLAPSCLNMGQYQTIQTHWSKKKQWFPQTENHQILISGLQYFQKEGFSPTLETYFQKLLALENTAEPYRTHILGLNFQKVVLCYYTLNACLVLALVPLSVCLDSWSLSLGYQSKFLGSWGTNRSHTLFSVHKHTNIPNGAQIEVHLMNLCPRE